SARALATLPDWLEPASSRLAPFEPPLRASSKARGSLDEIEHLARPPPPRHAQGMGQPAEKRPRATYADLEAVPRGKIAELINGRLFVSSFFGPRPAKAHSAVLYSIGRVFDNHADGGSGGWQILSRPELHFPVRLHDDKDVLVPEVVGWRCARL